MWKYRNVEVRWLGHDTFIIKGSKTVIIDPFKAKGDTKADLLLISHEHYDHLSEDDIKRFAGPSTVIVAPKVCEPGLAKFKQEKKFVEPNSEAVLKGVTVGTIPAYNTNKFREPGKVFHPKADGRVGYIVTMDGVRFYHAGDSDATPEMKALEVDVALVPVSGTYVMTAEEAADAVKAMKVKVAVPMHYGKIVGSEADAKKFKQLVGNRCAVEILTEE